MNWKQKLSSRKMWAAVSGFVTALLVVFNVPDLTIEKALGLVSAVAVLAVYIFAEGNVDAKHTDEGKGGEDSDDN